MNKNKIISFFCALSLIYGGIIPFSADKCTDCIQPAYAAENEDPTDISCFAYRELADGTLEITAYNTREINPEILVIPDEINGKKVTGIGESAFDYYYNLYAKARKIVIPEGVTYIGKRAFAQLYNVEEIIIPESVCSIGEDAFYQTAWLERKNLKGRFVTVNGILITVETDNKEITIPEGVTCIASNATNGNAEKIILPSSVVHIDSHAFGNCEKLTEIEIPESVNSIGEDAFAGTPWLEQKEKENELVTVNDILISGKGCSGEVVVPDNIRQIAGGAFRENKNIVNVSLPEGVTEIGNAAFSGCSALRGISAPDSIVKIGKSAFENCLSLESISVPEGVSVIEEKTFSKCRYLESVKLSEKLTAVDNEAFESCYNLKNIVFPDNIRMIGERAFSGCENITEVILPEGTETIRNEAFSHCYGLERVVLPESIRKIGYETFIYCIKLAEVSFPDGIIPGALSFKHTPWLENKQKENPLVTFGDVLFDASECEGVVTIPDNIKQIGEYAFAENQKVTEVIIPEGIETIGRNVFYSCENLETVKIPDSVTVIGENAFIRCLSLQEINLPAGLKEIREHAFAELPGIKSVVIPDGVTKIYNGAFYMCDELRDITLPASVEFIGIYAFVNGSDIVIHADEGSYAERYAQENGHSFVSVSGTEKTEGDVDGNGAVTTADIVKLIRFLLNYDVEIIKENADISGDGKVNILDLTLLKNKFMDVK